MVGFAWFPLLVAGRVNDGEQSIKVSATLPAGYLSYEPFGLGKGNIGPDVRWVDGGRPIFKFSLRLVSTTYTKDQHLHNFFAHCEKMTDSLMSPAQEIETTNRLKASEDNTFAVPTISSYDREMLTFVKSLHAVDPAVLISFLPTLFSQLLRLLTHTTAREVAENACRALVHAVTVVHDKNRPAILNTYVQYVFETEAAAGMRQRTVHEELSRHLKSLLMPNNTDQLVVSKFMLHAGFFFDIIIKSMAQHLLGTGRIKMSRNERFPSNLQFYIQGLVQVLTTHIVQKYREEPARTRSANRSLALFIKKCITFMDRGFVFKLINSYMENFSPNDQQVLHEYKFELLQVICEHEHFVPLNLPLLRKNVKNYKASPAAQRRHKMSLLASQYQDVKHDYTLSEDFLRSHFLVGLLLQETRSALNQIRDVRKIAMATLRNLLAKHAFDDRYANRSQQARIASLYLPFVAILLDNKHRLSARDPPPPSTTASSMVDTASVITDRSSHFDSSFDRVTLTSNSSCGQQQQQQQRSGSLPRFSKDPSVFALIAGQVSSLPDSIHPNLNAHHDSSGSLNSNTSSHSSSTIERDKESITSAGHNRSPSTVSGATPYSMRYDKLDSAEIRDLLVCYLYIVKNLDEDVLLGWFNNSSEFDILHFMEVLELCMHQFKYRGKQRITSLCIISDHKRTFNSKRPPPSAAFGRNNSAQIDPSQLDGLETNMALTAKLEANLSAEAALTILDIVTMYTNHFKEPLRYNDGDTALMHKVFDLHLLFLQTAQAEAVQKHAFAALRAFINKFPKVLFQGEATMCGRLCYEVLRSCHSRLPSTRSEACALMYLLMRTNFEYTKRRNFTRVHLQMIIAVSQLNSERAGLTNARFIDSLSVINSYTASDKAIQKTVFEMDVRDLTKRLRTVLMATAALREHQDDPERLADLQYELAKSYTSTPELRKTWLDAMAKLHIKHKNYSEAAHCVLHIAALVAEYLKRTGEFPQGCEAFRALSPNVVLEEAGMKDDTGVQDVPYTTDSLTELLEECARLLEQAERYELLGHLYRLIIPIYEKKRDFDRVAAAYAVLHRAYTKVVDVMQSRRRLLGQYFRVGFYGQVFDHEHQKQYIYKEPMVTGLPEICDRLHKLYSDKYGRDVVHLFKDSAKVNQSKLDPKLAYIQITHVVPYFDEAELKERVTDFERNNNIKHFSFETPFTKSGSARGEVSEQWKTRTILTTSHSLPYIKKRIQVAYVKDIQLSPIDCALDEMKTKVEELDDVVNQSTPDAKKLQLKLQGAVSVQVNAGPLAYAEAFLTSSTGYDKQKVDTLKEYYRDFVSVCGLALERNGQLIGADQLQYQEALTDNFRLLAARLSQIFGEQLLADDPSCSLSNHRGSVLSVVSNSSSTA